MKDKKEKWDTFEEYVKIKGHPLIDGPLISEKIYTSGNGASASC